MTHPSPHTNGSHPSTTSASAGEIRGVCPIDLSPLPPVPVTSTEAIHKAVSIARGAQEEWADRSLAQRIEALREAARVMLRTRDEVIERVRSEVGKLEVEGLFNEALGPLDAISGWAKVVEQGTAPKNIRLNPLAFPKKSASVSLVPRGVIGIIAPWNFPVAGLYRSIFPALLSGNGVVLKPSEFSPRSSAWLIETIAPHVPAGLVQVVQGDGAVGKALVDAGIDACVFTGSVATGKKVQIQCAERGIPCSAEMGGKDAAIVLADCDLPRTVAGITQWALNNVGQSCGAIEIAYVDNRIADDFCERIAHAWQRLRLGLRGRGETDISPIANARQVAIVESHIADAIKKGAKVLAGGRRTGEGLFFEPTILDHCTRDMLVVREETFGPVLAIVRVDGAAEAARHVQRSRYGLGASIWTGDLARGRRLAEKLDVGVVGINNHGLTGAIPELPWSGTRDTGHGVANSIHSLSTFVRPKTVLVDASKDPEVFWFPFDKTLYELGDILADAQLGKIVKAWKLPFLIRRRLSRVRDFFA